MRIEIVKTQVADVGYKPGVGDIFTVGYNPEPFLCLGCSPAARAFGHGCDAEHTYGVDLLYTPVLSEFNDRADVYYRFQGELRSVE